MKCPNCSAKHKHKEGMTCKCGYQFALDPKQDRCTDGKFQSFNRAASNNGANYFTENQLFTAANRKSVPNTSGLIAGVIALFVAVICAVLQVWLFAVFAAIGGFILCATYVHSAATIPVPRDRFDKLLRKFQSRHGPLDKLVRPGSFSQPPKEWSEPDIFDYGVEAILIVQNDILVDLFVHNKMHTTNRTLIMSGNDYPSYIAQHVDRILSESPELPVFLLHDATVEGQAWLKEQADSPRFNNQVRPVIDLGMHPEDFQRIKKLKPLNLARENYESAVDYLPMAMMATGLALGFERQIGMGQMLADQVSPDSAANFG